MDRIAEFEITETCPLAQSRISKKESHHGTSFKFLIMFLGCDKKKQGGEEK